MGLAEEQARIAAVAATYAEEGEIVSGVVATELLGGRRVYLCSFERGEARSWLALDDDGAPVQRGSLVREAAAIAALCEVAEETAGGGNLEELRSTLVSLRLTEAPVGIEAAEEAALALEATIGAAPRLASASYLDAIGSAVRRLEQALGETGNSPFASAMQQAVGIADVLAADIAAHSKVALH